MLIAFFQFALEKIKGVNKNISFLSINFFLIIFFIILVVFEHHNIYMKDGFRPNIVFVFVIPFSSIKFTEIN
jgi:hypothetical protein